jgi:hypothetical protein
MRRSKPIPASSRRRGNIDNDPSGLRRYDSTMHAIHNARIQLLATALNNLGVGATIAGVVAPMANGTVGDLAHIAAWFALGADLVAMAQAVLGRLR